MDNNSSQQQVWIPFKAQEGRLSTLVKISNQDGFPDFIGWFNRQLEDNNIPLSFDYESEITNQVMKEHGLREIGTVGDLMDWTANRTELFKAQRLIRFQPRYIETREGIVGLVCDTAPNADEFFIPDSIMTTALFPDQVYDEAELNAVKTATSTYKDSILFSCHIIAFICDPLF